MSARDLARAIRRFATGRPDFVRLDGAVLPAADLRFCGSPFRDDAFYLRSADAEASRLTTRLGCHPGSRVLDIGCGQGRLATGLIRAVGALDYLGLDVHRASIRWCRRHIQAEHPTYRFERLGVANARYNPRGARLDARFRFDLPDRCGDIIYLFSVFSHMPEAELRVYLAEFQRVLARGGRVFFTTFVEDGVPPVSINPRGYAFAEPCGPLHVVRYERSHLFSLVEAAGFEVAEFVHGCEVDGQSGVYLRRRERRGADGDADGD